MEVSISGVMKIQASFFSKAARKKRARWGKETAEMVAGSSLGRWCLPQTPLRELGLR